MADKVVWELSKLHEWDKNPRTITNEAFERLKWQIEHLTEYKPLLINQDGVVLGGNMRLRAYRELGKKEVWVSVVQTKSEEEMWEYALSDNDHVGRTDSDILANEMPNLNIDWSKYAVDLKESTNLDALLDQFKEVEEDEAPEVSDELAVSKLGEVYQLGRHRLMCGDSTKIEDVEKLMNGQKADFFFGDPPYGMRLDTNYSLMHSYNSMGYSKKHERVIGDDADFDAGLVVPIVDSIKDQIWFGADYYAHSLGDTEHSGSWGVWDKRVEESQDKIFGSCFELFWSRQKRKRVIYRFRWAAFFTQGEKREYNHPTSKSVKMISKLLEDYSNGDNVLDLFGGSGSTLIACEQTNRTCYMMEIDPKYCDVIRKRYSKFIGKESKWITETPRI